MLKKNKIKSFKRKYIQDSNLLNIEKIFIFNNIVSFFFNKLVTLFMNHGLKKKNAKYFFKNFSNIKINFFYAY